MRGERRRRAAVRSFLVVALVAALGAATTLALLLLAGPENTGARPRSAAVDLAGVPVEFDVPPPATVHATLSGTRFAVPSVGLDVPLGAMDVVDGVATPPGFTAVYVLRDVGVPLGAAARGTVFAVTHSLREGLAPGNYLFDRESGAGVLAPGAVILVGDLEYRVESSLTTAKSALPDADAVWADAPGRLVIITCLQRPDGAPATDNLVITATLAGPAATALPEGNPTS